MNTHRTEFPTGHPLKFVFAHSPALLVGTDRTGWVQATVKAVKQSVRGQLLIDDVKTVFNVPTAGDDNALVDVARGPTWVELQCRCAVRGSTPVKVRLVWSLSRNMARWVFGGFLLGSETRLRSRWRTSDDSVLAGLVQQGDEAQVRDSFLSLVTLMRGLERRERRQKRRVDQLENEVRRHKTARLQQDRVWEAFVHTTNELLTDALELAHPAPSEDAAPVADSSDPPPISENVAPSPSPENAPEIGGDQHSSSDESSSEFFADEEELMALMMTDDEGEEDEEKNATHLEPDCDQQNDENSTKPPTSELRAFISECLDTPHSNEGAVASQTPAAAAPDAAQHTSAPNVTANHSMAYSAFEWDGEESSSDFSSGSSTGTPPAASAPGSPARPVPSVAVASACC